MERWLDFWEMGKVSWVPQEMEDTEPNESFFSYSAPPTPTNQVMEVSTQTEASPSLIDIAIQVAHREFGIPLFKLLNTIMNGNKNYKTITCRNIEKHCPYGNECDFAHSSQESSFFKNFWKSI